MNNEEITAYVTKYALTEGIIKTRGEVCHSISSTMFKYNNGGLDKFAHGKDWHRTTDAAMARAEEMRVKKIESLKKGIEKLEAMDFNGVEK